MFLTNETSEKIEEYKNMLKVIGSLSNLFSESKSPYLVSRTTENLFCKIFSANNLSRGDTSADASKESIGIGIKTFLESNGRTFQKVAEFNKNRKVLNTKSDLEEFVKSLSEMRNERLETTKRIHGLNDLLYHCITRKEGKIIVYETPMHKVNISEIRGIEENDSSINFNDGIDEYKFSLSKSTLYKKFYTPESLISIDVKIIEDPFETLKSLLSPRENSLNFEPISKEKDHIFLPLYSPKEKRVYDKSGLNQWNAGGRNRSLDEVYISIPSIIHKKFPDFFPPRDVPFNLKLPNQDILNVSLCQENSKALMSNPNKALGVWLLRKVLNLKEGELLTYKKLEEIGLDSVVIYKESEGNYTIDFTKTSSYDDFISETSEIS